MITLETARLRLRMFRDTDLDAYAAMSADPEVMRYLGATGQPLTRPEAWRQMATFLGHWTLRGYGVWAVEERASGEFVGRIGLFYPDGWPGLECIWALARGAWGKGYATEGARRAIEYAFSELASGRVISLIRPGNTASIRVAERLGETLEGSVTLFGAEALVYGITRERVRR
jgi:RimJ/RimL family protein N-acetyltransferase